MTATPTTSITYQNFYSATLTSDITASSTDIFLDTVPNGSEGFLVIDPDSASAREVIYYNTKTATKVTCPSVADGRGQDDTTAGAHLTGTTVIMAPVAAYFEALIALFTTSPQGWTSLAGNFTSPTDNGNRSYDITTSTDQTSILSLGMRIKLTRTVTAPTQCTSLNGSTQYYNETTPAGMTFTDDFVASAWIKLTSYPAAAAYIASRYNGTSGWEFYINSNGQVTLAGKNAASANFSQVLSYQSIPLNKWVHVAAQLDMSTFTATTTTSYVMVDGVDVPSAVSRGGTNPTALVQAGNLEIGGGNGGGGPFTGKLAQVAIYSAKVTQATIKASKNQTLAGTETSLISAYSFNNVITDLNTTSANNLTAQGSALATNADSPYAQGSDAVTGLTAGTTEFGVVTKITASTLTVQVPAGSTIPTSGGITAAYYSTYNTPYGFPADRSKWRVLTTAIYSSGALAFGGANLWTSSLRTVQVPAGEWAIGFNGCYHFASSVSGNRSTFLCLSSTAPTNAVYNNDLQWRLFASTGTDLVFSAQASSNLSIKLTALTTYTLYAAIDSSTGAETFLLRGDQSPICLYADCAYI